VHHQERDQKDRSEHGEPDQIQRLAHRRGQYQAIDCRETDDEADAQQQIATDLSPVSGEMGAPEAPLQIGIVELEAWKASLELQRVIRPGRRIRTACVTCLWRRPGD
jgi:hypothetical protein